MELISDRHPLVVVVGSGGVGKTTLAASMGVLSARAGRDTLVMTFDPSLRLKDALGVGEEAKLQEMPVPLDAPGRLYASLLDARQTFDRLIQRYAQEEEASRRILENRFYQQLSGTLSGILEYMAVERLFEVEAEGRYAQVILDTPPTRQALRRRAPRSAYSGPWRDIVSSFVVHAPGPTNTSSSTSENAVR